MTYTTLSSERVTSGIRVAVDPYFLPDHSTPEENKFVFGYRVRLFNEGDEPAQLTDRHWIIIDADGERRDVRGEGVIGQQPRIAPGESFEYASYCPLATEWGTMEGSFTMLRDNGESFEATVDRFYLVASTEAAPTPEPETA